jgi:hypothetical protein
MMLPFDMLHSLESMIVKGLIETRSLHVFLSALRLTFVAFSTLVDDSSPDRSVIIATKSGFGLDPVSAQFALLAILV